MSTAGQMAKTQPAIPKGPATKVNAPVEHPTGAGSKVTKMEKLIAEQRRIAENQQKANAYADYVSQRMRETQGIRESLIREGRLAEERKFVGDIFQEADKKIGPPDPDLF